MTEPHQRPEPHRRPGRDGPPGHRTVPHTADTRIEAWSPDREGCLAQAVAGLVESFADLSAARPRRTETVHLAPAPVPDLLVALLEEVVYRLDAHGEIPLESRLTATPDGGLEARLTMAPTASVEAVGALPKAVSLHGLELDHDDGWRCAFTVDV
jgi:SHS2 domain-containing protein